MTARHRRGLGCIVAPLPNLAPDRRTEINLLVKIFLIHLREKLLEGRFPFLNGRGNDLPVGNRQVQHRAFLDPCVFSRWFGNPNGETVSSFLNANMHLRSSLFVSTKEVTVHGIFRQEWPVWLAGAPGQCRGKSPVARGEAYLTCLGQVFLWNQK
jgi:hypothetical protein